MEPRLEITVLRLLCLGTPQGSVRKAGLSLLRNYGWQNALHKALWDAISSLPAANPESLRLLLPAKLTRLGFPDFEWDDFFAPLSTSKAEALDLMRRLAGGG